MSWLKVWAILLFISATLVAPHTAQACPACSAGVEAASAKTSEEDADDFPRAMNQSIYLMVSVPYAVLLVGGVLIYRGCKGNTQYMRARCSELVQSVRTDQQGIAN